ncbi:hypothetical protein BDZ45DRAFT_751569 [Acephala macrosclerotiorum]|nr:hypothetical protein BDZ45DRAFT_751569 [Acephala macrosclerotiorum]
MSSWMRKGSAAFCAKVSYTHPPFRRGDHDEVDCDCCTRRFLIEKDVASTCRAINKSKPGRDRWAVQDPSEGGWNLHENHPRHFFIFSQGVNILCITPELQEQNSSIFNPRDDPTSAHTPLLGVFARSNRDGTYYELRNVFRKEIDTSFLRTCKKLHVDG